MSVETITHGQSGYHVALIEITHDRNAWKWAATVRNDGYADEDCPRFEYVGQGVEDTYHDAVSAARDAFRVHGDEGEV